MGNMKGIKMDRSFWTDRNVFVTGANGFLGSWMCRTLFEKGAHVVGLVRDDIARSYLNVTGMDRRIDIVHGELENAALLERILNEFEIEFCFHLGAQPIVTTANRFPISTFESNIRGTWNLLEALRHNKEVKMTVVASSDKAYGSQSRMPYTEDAPLAGMNPYDFTKTCTDMMAQMYHRCYDVPLAISRCGNFFGPGDLNFSRIVPGTIRSLVHGKRPVIRSDGRYLRDYFFIEDAVSAYMALAENGDKTIGQAFNFGTETPTSVIEIVDKIIKLSGQLNLKPKILGKAKDEILVQYLSCEKAWRVLAWKPKVSLDVALVKTVRWYEGFLKA